jgi:hypothetical protein
MPRPTVVDVGDGACSVLRCDCVSPYQCACPIAVVDCGAWKAAAERPGEKLRNVLGPEGIRRLGTIVVTHFDADHWAGLRYLAASLASSECAHLRLIYPRLPEREQDTAAATLALLSLSTGHGVRALELGAALEEVKPIELLPLRDGDSFRAAGRDWRVVWPPQQLPKSILRGLRSAVEAAESLAADLDRDGYPRLRNALQEAYARPFPGAEALEAKRDGVQEEEWDLPVRERAEEEEWDLPEHEPAEPDGFHGTQSHDELVPQRWRDEFRRVARQVAAANNDLSLVFHDGRVGCFGDVQSAVLDHILRSRRLPSFLGIVLAPHHGTVPVPASFPKAALCIAQAGMRHVPNWHKHVDTHGQHRSCVNTARVGTLSSW